MWRCNSGIVENNIIVMHVQTESFAAASQEINFVGFSAKPYFFGGFSACKKYSNRWLTATAWKYSAVRGCLSDKDVSLVKIISTHMIGTQ